MMFRQLRSLRADKASSPSNLQGTALNSVSTLSVPSDKLVDVRSVHLRPLLSGYNSNRFNWLAETTKPSWESGGWSACKMGVFSKSVTLKICRIW